MTVGWEQLGPEERKSLLRNTFEDPEWFPLREWILDDGSITYDLGLEDHQRKGILSHLAGRLNVPIIEIRRYFAAWCASRQMLHWRDLLGIEKSNMWSFSTMEEEIPLEDA